MPKLTAEKSNWRHLKWQEEGNRRKKICPLLLSLYFDSKTLYCFTDECWECNVEFLDRNTFHRRCLFLFSFFFLLLGRNGNPVYVDFIIRNAFWNDLRNITTMLRFWLLYYTFAFEFMFVDRVCYFISCCSSFSAKCFNLYAIVRMLSEEMLRMR